MVRGVNHCRSYRRLASFRGLMYGGNYSAVIGLKGPIAWKLILGTYKNPRFSTNHRAVFPAKRQCERQWLTSSSLGFPCM